MEEGGQYELIERVLALASNQLGLFTTRQASALGITNSMLDAATARGWIARERKGVYAVRGTPASAWRLLYAAALAAGPKAIISHASAGAVYTIHGVVAGQPELIVPHGINRRLAGVTIHGSKTLLATDVQVRHGVQITNPVRTVIDLAARMHEPLLGTIIDEGTISRLWTPEAVQARLDQLPYSVPGRAQLARVLALRMGEGQPDSRLEQRVFRVLTPLFPGYTIHHRVVLDGKVVEMDIAWVDQKIDGEVDGLAPRAQSRTKLERSARRANLLGAHGWRVVHFTHQMTDEELVAQLAPYFPR